MSNTPGAYERTTFRGEPLDHATVAALQEMEAMLGYELTVLQGIGGAAASAGTHLGLNGEGGRAVDLAPFDWKRKLLAGLACGFIGWHRLPLAGVWSEHVHMVLVLDRMDNARGIAPAAFRQIAAYVVRRTDGLAQDRPDKSDRPDLLHVFHYPPKGAPVSPFANDVTRARDKFTEAAHAIGEGIVYLQRTDPKRKVARAGIPIAKAIRRSVNGLLRTLPRK